MVVPPHGGDAPLEARRHRLEQRANGVLRRPPPTRSACIPPLDARAAKPRREHQPPRTLHAPRDAATSGRQVPSPPERQAPRGCGDAVHWHVPLQSPPVHAHPPRPSVLPAAARDTPAFQGECGQRVAPAEAADEGVGKGRGGMLSPRAQPLPAPPAWQGQGATIAQMIGCGAGLGAEAGDKDNVDDGCSSGGAVLPAPKLDLASIDGIVAWARFVALGGVKVGEEAVQTMSEGELRALIRACRITNAQETEHIIAYWRRRVRRWPSLPAAAERTASSPHEHAPDEYVSVSGVPSAARDTLQAGEGGSERSGSGRTASPLEEAAAPAKLLMDSTPYRDVAASPTLHRQLRQMYCQAVVGTAASPSALTGSPAAAFAHFMPTPDAERRAPAAAEEVLCCEAQEDDAAGSEENPKDPPGHAPPTVPSDEQGAARRSRSGPAARERNPADDARGRGLSTSKAHRAPRSARSSSAHAAPAVRLTRTASLRQDAAQSAKAMLAPQGGAARLSRASTAHRRPSPGRVRPVEELTRAELVAEALTLRGALGSREADLAVDHAGCSLHTLAKSRIAAEVRRLREEAHPVAGHSRGASGSGASAGAPQLQNTRTRSMEDDFRVQSFAAAPPPARAEDLGRGGLPPPPSARGAADEASAYGNAARRTPSPTPQPHQRDGAPQPAAVAPRIRWTRTHAAPRQLSSKAKPRAQTAPKAGRGAAPKAAQQRLKGRGAAVTTGAPPKLSPQRPRPAACDGAGAAAAGQCVDETLRYEWEEEGASPAEGDPAVTKPAYVAIAKLTGPRR